MLSHDIGSSCIVFVLCKALIVVINPFISDSASVSSWLDLALFNYMS